MSFRAFQHVGQLTGLTPNQKLLLYELANFHDQKTERCYPSAATLAAKSGMSIHQVVRTVNGLVEQGILAQSPTGFRFPHIANSNAPGAPVPENFRPAEGTIAALVADFPNHDFNVEDAIHDFIQYARENGITPRDPDAAFERNIRAILQRRRPGPVHFGRAEGGAETASVRSLLSGRR